MKTNNNQNLESNDVLFQFEDDFARESDIYFEIASEDFQNENSFLLEETETDNLMQSFFWEENDEFGIYD